MRSIGMQRGPASKEVIKLPDGKQLNLRASRSFGNHKVKGYGADAPLDEDDRLLMHFHKRGPPLSPAPQSTPEGCGACGNIGAALVCTRCRMVLFCDGVCQRRAWPQHKITCEPLEDLLAKFREEERLFKEVSKPDTNNNAKEKEEEMLSSTLKDFFERRSKRTKSPESKPQERRRPDWLNRKVGAAGQPTDQTPPVAATALDANLPAEPCQEDMCSTDCLTLYGTQATVDMPRIVLGTGGQEGLHGREGRAAMLAALKMGYRGIDTSEMNRNLLDVRWACEESGIERNELFIIVKIPPWNHGYEAAKRSLDRQLNLLKLSHADLLLVQWPHVWLPEQQTWGPMQWRRVEEWKAAQLKGTWAALEELHKSGRARAIGASNYSVDHLEALLQHCVVPPMVVQGESNPHWTNRPLRDWCRKHGIAFQGYAPFGGQKTDVNAGHRAVDEDVVKAVAERHAMSPFAVCMQWNQSRNSSTVVKSKQIAHLRSNLNACKGAFCSPKDLGRIDGNADTLKKYGPCYWGFNDMDGMHPWKDEEKLLESMLPGKAKSPEEIKKECWEPRLPEGSVIGGLTAS
mmetsp:Transcript_129003/g.306051  ORF Transcript_129003/g.306051 Transcript_129003/m.306051 type:complete len:573 (-) Transcript_129003:27-1745(-)